MPRAFVIRPFKKKTDSAGHSIDVVVCDVTIHNANVFYELGIRHALRKKRTVLIKGSPTAEPTPFDNLTDRYVPYQIDNAAAALSALTGTSKAALDSERHRQPDF
jgi:hypothetical protein